MKKRQTAAALTQHFSDQLHLPFVLLGFFKNIFVLFQYFCYCLYIFVFIFVLFRLRLNSFQIVCERRKKTVTAVCSDSVGKNGSFFNTFI